MTHKSQEPTGLGTHVSRNLFSENSSTHTMDTELNMNAQLNPELSNEQIQQHLEQTLNDPNVCCQVVRQDPYLLVYLNREPEHSLNYSTVSQLFSEAIARLQLPDIQFLGLYSRVIGETDPDWQICLELSASSLASEPSLSVASEPSSVSVESGEIYGVEPVSTEETNPPKDRSSSQAIRSDSQDPSVTSVDTEDSSLDLSGYCFTRNLLLLSAHLPSPPDTIKNLLQTFDGFSNPEKQLLLPHLVKHWGGTLSEEKSPGALSETLQDWLTSLQNLNPEQTRKAGIWLSRYCQNPTETRTQVLGVVPEKENKPFAPSTSTSSTETPSASKPSPKSHDSGRQTFRPSAQTASSSEPIQSPNYSQPTKGRSPISPQQPVHSQGQPGKPKKTHQSGRSLGTRSPLQRLILPVGGLVCLGFILMAVIAITDRKKPPETAKFCQQLPTSQTIPPSPEPPTIPELERERAEDELSTATVSSVNPQEYCQLAVQIAGEETILKAAQNADPINNESKPFLSLCEDLGNARAGMLLKEALREKTSALTIGGAEIIPGIFVATAEQINAKPDRKTDVVKTACVFRHHLGRPQILGTDEIPVDWPDEPYLRTSI